MSKNMKKNQYHIHILGICGTFMGGLAIIARQMGFYVTGSDNAIYPPMSDYLEKEGIKILDYAVSSIPDNVNEFIIGNCMSRGMPIIEYILSNSLPYESGPSWLSRHVLKDKRVIAVSGTHGKTTTTSMIIKILQDNGLNPSFLVGGLSPDLGVTAAITNSKYFVIEADEYDTSFFDKRSKFIHYNPQILVINNLEYDHADIFGSLEEIKKQFHFLIRKMPQECSIIYPSDDKNIKSLLSMGVWSKQYSYSSGSGRDIHRSKDGDWEYTVNSPCFKDINICTSFGSGRLVWEQIGRHNLQNGLSAMMAAFFCAVPLHKSIESLRSFSGVKRRMEVIFTSKNIVVYDEFAHHPTAIKETITSIRATVGDDKILVIFEPRSNTMRMGVHTKLISQSFKMADYLFVLSEKESKFNFNLLKEELTGKCDLCGSIDEILIKVGSRVNTAKTHILIMSNGAFGGIHDKLIDLLAPIASNE